MKKGPIQRLKEAVAPWLPKPVFSLLWMRARRKAAAQAGMKLVTHDVFFDLVKGDTVLRIRDAHMLYLQHMIENFDYFVGSVIPIRVDGVKLVDMSGPRYHRLKGFADIPFLFPSQTEPFETTAEYLEFADLKDGDIVLDIGAYAGVTSIIFAQLVGCRGHVFAFEADGLNYECAQTNIQMAAKVMGIKNITLLRKAVWSHGEGVLFSNEGTMGSSAVAITGGKRGQEQTVESVRLEDFFAQRGLSRADFVKMDIEGGEVEVLRVSAKFLSGIKARLIVEPHVVNGELCTEQCRVILESAGYKVKVRDKVGESHPLIEAVP
jgi:FkbM family methyltransferase